MFILGQQRAPQFCNFCQESDHSSSQCALAFLEPAPQNQTLDQRVTRRICRLWNTSRCIYPGSCYYHHVCLSCLRGTRLSIAQCRESLQGRLLRLQLQSRVQAHRLDHLPLFCGFSIFVGCAWLVLFFSFLCANNYWIT